MNFFISQLGKGYANVGRFNDAHEIFERQLQLRLRKYKTREHNDVATTMKNLADAKAKLGKSEECLQVLEEVKGIYAKEIKIFLWQNRTCKSSCLDILYDREENIKNFPIKFKVKYDEIYFFILFL